MSIDFALNWVDWKRKIQDVGKVETISIRLMPANVETISCETRAAPADDHGIDHSTNVMGKVASTSLL